MTKTRALPQLLEDRNSLKIESVGSATGPWGVPEVPIACRSTRPPSGFLPPLGLSVFLAFTPLTAVADPWSLDARSSAGHVITWPEKRRRQLQLREASRLALQIMERAELARKEAVAAEYVLACRLEDQG